MPVPGSGVRVAKAGSWAEMVTGSRSGSVACTVKSLVSPSATNWSPIVGKKGGRFTLLTVIVKLLSSNNEPGSVARTVAA